MRARVEETNACALPGCAIKYDTFIPAMWRAVARGFVSHDAACFVGDGLRHGFTAGVDVPALARMGNRWFANYNTAVGARVAVRQAIMKRVDRGKTLSLGVWTSQLARQLRDTFTNTFIAPLGAVEKALERGVYRPTTDHTRTGLNSHTDLSFLRHSLQTYDEIAYFLQTDYFMRMSDVEDAFPMLPLHPDVWPYFMYRFYVDDTSDTEALFLNCMGDFGAAGMPGTFKIFFADVVVGMARAAQVLTLPMPIYVDDCALIGPDRDRVDLEMRVFQVWAADVCGVTFKYLKDRAADTRQLALGFWWDSTTLTRELEERKLLQYLDFLADFATRPTLTLREMQQMAGRLQRCLKTLPPGAACLATSLYALMAGLKLPWHARRTSRQVREDFKCIHRLLTMNLGKGFYSYANFRSAPAVCTDASKQATFAGGGWVSACGAYDWWVYGTAAARKMIDFLEGDTVVEAVRALAPRWRGCVVEFWIDNSAFQKSGAKGRSRAQRLNDLLRELFVLMVQYGFVIAWMWISTHDNINADHLSRGRPGDFLRTVYETGFWSADTVPQPGPMQGAKRTLPERRGAVPRELAAVTDAADADLAAAASELEAAAAALGAASTLDPGAADFVPAAPTAGGTGGGASEMRAALERVEAREGDGAAAARLPYARMQTWAPRRRGGTTMLVLALFGCFCVQEGSSMPLTALQASIPYTRTSIFTGMPDDLRTHVVDIMDARLSESTWRTVRAGVKRWWVTCANRRFARVISTDDPERGAKLAAFVFDLITTTPLRGSTIVQYVYGVRVWNQAQGMADPIMGVDGWEHYMKGVEVLTWAPGEPRKAVPFEVIDAMLDYVLDGEDEFFMIQMAFLLIVLFYTFSRSECPCPKTVNGRQNYDKEKHFRVEDFDVGVVPGTGGVRALWARFRGIKQDPRVQRPEARSDRGDGRTGDWSCLGEVSVDKWNPLFWYTKLTRAWGRRREPRDGPMFLDENQEHPLTYGKALRWFYGWQRAVGVAEEDLAGLHGLRVTGYNRAKNALGQQIAQAHGLWKSTAVNRYERFEMSQVVRIPGALAGVDPGVDYGAADATVERQAGSRGVTRATLRAAAAGSSSQAAPAAASSDDDDDGADAASGFGSDDEADDDEEAVSEGEDSAGEVYFTRRSFAPRGAGERHWTTPPRRAPNALQVARASPPRPGTPRPGSTPPAAALPSMVLPPPAAQSTSGQQ